MYADFSIQQAVIREVVVYAELESTPLLIKLDARSGASFGQICLHLENRELALALAKAINETLQAFEAAPSAEAA